MLGGKRMASLNGGLLARKGEARPAMRPQYALDAVQQPLGGDDLGWNDFGEAGVSGADGVAAAPLPPVLEQRERLAAGLGAAPDMPAGRKAAFTVRLDRNRHLDLRLAAATRGRSAQQIVVEALDAFIATMPEIPALRRRLADDGQPNAQGN